jgi:hypothetical protein
MSSHLSQSHNFHIAHTPTQQPKSSSTQRKKSFNKNSSPNFSQSLSLQTIDFSTVKSPQGKKQLCLSCKTLFQFHRHKFDVSFCKIDIAHSQNNWTVVSQFHQFQFDVGFCKIDTDCSQKTIEKINKWKKKVKTKCNLTTSYVSKELKRWVVGPRTSTRISKSINVGVCKIDVVAHSQNNWTQYIYLWKKKVGGGEKKSNLMTTSVSKEPKRWDEFQAKEGAQSSLLWAQWTCKQKLQMVGGWEPASQPARECVRVGRESVVETERVSEQYYKGARVFFSFFFSLYFWGFFNKKIF